MQYCFIIFLISLCIECPALAIDCKSLDSNDRITEFVKKSKKTNPLMSNHLSALIEMNPCEKEVCQPENSTRRNKNKEILHIIKIGRNERLNFIKGVNSPQCFVRREEREFKCDSCALLTNNHCRSYHSSADSTKFKGTNIDRSDFDLLEDENHHSVCETLNRAPKYFRIVTTKTAGISQYDKIIAYYEKVREIPIMINFFAGNRLFKVYRFFPGYYIKVEDNWYSTLFRARTTLGNEKQYIFETLIKIKKDNDGNYHIYPQPEDDPYIQKGNYDDLFNTD